MCDLERDMAMHRKMVKEKAEKDRLFTKELKEEWRKTQDNIQGYHIHIYFDFYVRPSFAHALSLTSKMELLFKDYIKESRNEVGAVGPHTKRNFLIEINKEGLKEILPWLQMNKPEGISILVHPETGDDVKDHLHSAIWVGDSIPFNQEFFDRLQAKQNNQSKKAYTRKR